MSDYDKYIYLLITNKLYIIYIFYTKIELIIYNIIII